MPFDSLPASQGSITKPVRPATALLGVSVRMPDGGRLSPLLAAHQSISGGLERFGIAMRRSCHGHGYCTDCRARIGTAWISRLPPPSAEEVAALLRIPDADAATRLLCQIEMTPQLEGLELELGWDALVPQTSWVAG